jgi:hypothetical protein
MGKRAFLDDEKFARAGSLDFRWYCNRGDKELFQNNFYNWKCHFLCGSMV